MLEFSQADRVENFLDAQYAPFGEFAPGVYYAQPDIVPALLKSGEYVNYEDFRNASHATSSYAGHGMSTFRATVRHLAHDLDPAFVLRLEQSMTSIDNHPDRMRQRLLIGTQAIANIFMHENKDVLDGKNKPFRPKLWRVLNAVIEDPSPCDECSITEFLYQKSASESVKL